MTVSQMDEYSQRKAEEAEGYLGISALKEVIPPADTPPGRRFRTALAKRMERLWGKSGTAEKLDPCYEGFFGHSEVIEGIEVDIYSVPGKHTKLCLFSKETGLGVELLYRKPGIVDSCEPFSVHDEVEHECD